PSLARPPESAIDKHVAWAAAISSSGLVMPSGSSERAGQLTSRPPSAPLVTASTRPSPLIRSPCQVTSALRSVATRFSFRLFLLHARARLRHHFDLARVRICGLERKDFLQRADRNLYLVERRLARREA